MNKLQKVLVGVGLVATLSIPASLGLNGHYRSRLENMPYSEKAFTTEDMVKETQRFKEYRAELNTLYEKKEITEATAVTGGLVGVMAGIGLLSSLGRRENN